MAANNNDQEYGIFTTIYKSQKSLKDRKKSRKIGSGDEITITVNEFGILAQSDRDRFVSNASDDEKASVMSDERAYTAGGPVKPMSGDNPKCFDFNGRTKVVKSLPNESRKITFFVGNIVENRNQFYQSKNEIVYGLPCALIPSAAQLANMIEDCNDNKEGCVTGDSVEIIFGKRNDKIDNLLDTVSDNSQKTQNYGFDVIVREKYGISSDDILYFDIFINKHTYEQTRGYKESTPCGVCCTIL